MSTSATYKDILSDINEFYEENCVEVYAPSIDKKLNFKPLSVRQMKKFIELQVKTSKDELGILPSLEMVNDLNQYLIDNFVGKDAPGLLQRLTVLDRDCIIAQLRAVNNPNIEIAAEEGEEADQVSIEHILKNFDNHPLPPDSKYRECVLKYKSGEMTLKLRVPSLFRDSLINSYFKSQLGPLLRQGTKKLEKNLEKVLSQTYFVELSKYIELLEISKKDRTTVVTFDNVQTLTAQLKLLEQLPSKLIVEINDFVRSIKQYKDSAVYYVDARGVQKPLTVDINLFTTI